MSALFNQPDVEQGSAVLDQYYTERSALHIRINRFCRENNITFTLFVSEKLLEESKSDIIVNAWFLDLSADFVFWQSINETCKRLGKHLFVATDNVLEFPPLESITFVSFPTLIGINASYDTIKPIVNKPSKLYNCFIQRADSTRQSWFYFLQSNQLLDRGYVSFLLKSLDNYTKLTGAELFDWIHTNYQLDQLPQFESAYQELKTQVPYRNFTDQGDLMPFIADSKYSLVLETYAVEDNSHRWCFTEKSLRALQFPSVPLLFLQRGGIKQLKKLGLQFTDVMDYLDDLSWQERQQELLKILLHDSVDYDADLLYNQSLHNQQLLQSWRTEYLRSDFFDEFFNKVTSI